MALTFHRPTEKAADMWYISPQRYYLTATGAVVTEGDPRAATLLVGKGCRLPYALALRHGLVAAHEAPPATTARLRAPATKARPA